MDGVVSNHEVDWHSSCNSEFSLRNTVSKRIFSLEDAIAIASQDPITGCPINPLTGICTLDCPAHTHTSPISTSDNSIGCPSDIVIVYGPPASGVSTSILHFPSKEEYPV